MRGPSLAVSLALSNKVCADTRDGVPGEADDFLDIAVGATEEHANDQADHVDEADVAPDNTLRCQSELRESIVEASGRILEVGDGGLDKAVHAAAGNDHEEGKLALAEVNATR